MKILRIFLFAFIMLLPTGMMRLSSAADKIHIYTEQEQQLILSLVKASPVIATVNRDSSLTALPRTSAEKTAEIPASQKVEILRDRSTEWYYIQNSSHNVTGWLPAASLDIPVDPETNRKEMTHEQLEGYVNIKGFKSTTEYLIWTDIDRQLTYIFKGIQNNWKWCKTIVCSTGKNSSPTVRGIFKTQESGSWFFSERLKSGGKFWVRFSDTYLYHSVAMDQNKNITDDVLGRRHSNGCVRMSVDDAEWFYNTIPMGSTVFIN